MTKSKYITTSLPYANGSLECVGHIGHAFEFIIGDALSRYFKYNGYEVFFNLGLDEHGLKIQQTAEKKGITPKEHVDEVYLGWIKFLDKLNVNNWDSFYRTSDPEHISKVQKFWKELNDNGDIYKKKYKGNYCIGCESFKSDRELEDGKCLDHPTTEIQEIEEENYFFRLSKYKEHLLHWLHTNDKFFEPNNKINEFDKIVENIEDISISRLSKDVYWGIPVPGDDSQTIYVWLDALTNYIFSAGYYDNDKTFEKLWNNSDVIQICGPDNLKFQSIIFQGLLLSAGIKNSNKLLVHGTITDSNGKKMSKSEGNVIDPIEQVEKFGVDAVRYYALAGLRTYGNSSWNEDLLVAKYNSDLADDYGNLVTRITHLAGKFLNEHDVELDYSQIEESVFVQGSKITVGGIKALWNSYKISEALELTNKFVKLLNKKLGDEEPWRHLNEEGWDTILKVHYALDKINELYYPIFPEKSKEIKIALKECKKFKPFPKLEIKNI